MINFWSWYQEKVNSLKQTATETFDQSKTIAQFIYDYSPPINDLFDFSQYWSGFTRSTHPDVVPAFFTMPKTVRIFSQSFAANLIWYAGSAFVFEAMIKPAFEETPLERTTKIIAVWYFWRLSWRMCFLNAANNGSLSKAAYLEANNKVHDKACECGKDSTDIIKGNLASGFYYFGNTLAAKFVGMFIPYGEEIMLAQLYGLALLEYLLNQCTKHRNETLAKNNQFALGLGTALIIIYKVSSWLTLFLLEKVRAQFFNDPGEIETKYINDALFALVFQYFIAIVFLIDKPLPGVKAGKDIFYPARLVTEFFLKEGFDRIVGLLKKEPSQFVLQPLVDAVNKYPPLQLAKSFALYKDYQSLESFVKTKEVQMFLDLRGDDIQNVLDWFIEVRKKPITKRLAFVSPYIPDFLLGREMKDIIKFLVEKKLDGVLENINNFITTARLKITIKDRAALQRIAADKSLIPMITKSLAAPEEKAIALLRPLSEIIQIENYEGPTQTNKPTKKVGVATKSSLFQSAPARPPREDILDDWEEIPGPSKPTPKRSISLRF